MSDPSKDIRYTTDRLALAIVDRVCDLYQRAEGQPPAFVLEPSAGSGAFVRALRAHNLRVDAVEPQASERSALEAFDVGVCTGTLEHFLSVMPDVDYDLVIGNPPFSLAEAHIRLLLSRLNEGAYLAFLLRNTFFGSFDRLDFWQAFPLRAYIPITPRPSFTGGGTDMTEYGVFIWIAGLKPECSQILPHLVWRPQTRSKVGV